ncbi:hypothetical protein PtB15_14B334 [Puccinia triticina]|nr:hypothetical protein PtB15_14B334 [Puccinia triticina]
MSYHGWGQPFNQGGLSDCMEENQRCAAGQQHLHEPTGLAKKQYKLNRSSSCP